MSFRVVNGSSHTEDGWRCCNRDECDIVAIPNLYLTDTAPLRRGAPLIILGAWLFWYDRNVEEIDSPVWGWSLTNDVLGQWGKNNGSNHLSATAIDVNAPKYPWGTYRMSAAKIAKVEEGLRLFEGNVFWGRGWSKPDEMHYQMRWPEGDQRNDGFVRKLLDGYLGIYKAGPVPQPQPTGRDAVALLIINESKRRNHAPHETIAELATGLQESQLNPEAVDATGHRGVYQQDGGYPERYTVQGQVRGFFDRLDAKRASSGASQDIWLNIFWLQQRPSDPSADVAYARGRKAYLAEIKSRTPAATELYHRLAGSSPTGGFLMALNDNEQRRLLERNDQVWGAVFNPVPSKSRYGDPRDQWASKDFWRNDDGFLFDLITEHDAALGDPQALARVNKAAAEGDAVAANFLTRLSNSTPAPAPAPAPTPAPVVYGVGGSGGTAGVWAVPQEPLPYRPIEAEIIPEQTSYAPQANEPTFGELVGRAIDALSALRNVQGLSDRDRKVLKAIAPLIEDDE